VVVEDVGECSRDDPHLRRVVSHPLHRERLAGARLSVGEDRSIKALQHGVHQGSKGLFILESKTDFKNTLRGPSKQV